MYCALSFMWLVAFYACQVGTSVDPPAALGLFCGVVLSYAALLSVHIALQAVAAAKKQLEVAESKRTEIQEQLAAAQHKVKGAIYAVQQYNG